MIDLKDIINIVKSGVIDSFRHNHGMFLISLPSLLLPYSLYPYSSGLILIFSPYHPLYSPVSCRTNGANSNQAQANTALNPSADDSAACEVRPSFYTHNIKPSLIQIKNRHILRQILMPLRTRPLQLRPTTKLQILNRTRQTHK